MYNTATQDAIYAPENYFLWFLLSFQAGMVNVGGFLAAHRFVSHVTGFATHFGVELAGGHLGPALGMLSAPAFFLCGAVLSAFLVDRRRQQDRPPRYATALYTISAVFALTALLGLGGYFGRFGAAPIVEGDYLLLALLCGACGLQNALITSVSGAVVRTTHLTGICTDLGIGLVRRVFAAPGSALRRREGFANTLRVGTLLSFAGGSLFGALVFTRAGYAGFFAPMLSSLFVATRLLVRR
jgi:uncharacterized membrane protein YoaK (UPF0700 family)